MMDQVRATFLAFAREHVGCVHVFQALGPRPAEGWPRHSREPFLGTSRDGREARADFEEVRSRTIVPDPKGPQG